MKLNYTQVFESAWSAIRDQLALIAGLTAAYFFGIWILNRFTGITAILSGPLTAGYIQCLIQIRKNEVVNYEDLFWGFLNLNRFIHLVLLSILVSGGIALGTFLLVIPGIWWGVSTAFALSLFVLRKEDAIDSIMKSIEIVQQRWFNIFGFLICILLLLAAGAACLGVGLLIAFPVAMLSILMAAESLLETPMFQPLGSTLPPRSSSSEQTFRSE